MTIFLFLVTLAFFFILVVAAAMQPHHTALSMYELRRRVENGNRAAKDMLYRQVHLRDVEALLQLMVTIFLIVISFLLIATFGWIMGAVLIVVVLFSYHAVARVRFIHHLAAKLYNQLESRLFLVVEKAPGLISYIRFDRESNRALQLGSRQELEYLVHHSEDVLSADEKRMVIHSLTFSDKKVGDIMPPVDMITSIKKAEFLGPLTLDALHKSKHSHLPVIGQDINQVVGVLYLDTLLALDIKRSVTAEKAMDPRVFYVQQDQTLPHMLAALLRTHQHLFMVINPDKETVGLITLSDVVEALVGQKSIDEFDDHESIRAVSERSVHNKRDEA